MPHDSLQADPVIHETYTSPYSYPSNSDNESKSYSVSNMSWRLSLAAAMSVLLTYLIFSYAFTK